MKLVLFDIDGTLVRAGNAGRAALDAACLKLYGARKICGTFSLAGRTDLYNFTKAFQNSVGRKPSRRERELLQALYLKLLPSRIKRAVRSRTYILPPGIRSLLRRLKREKNVILALGTGNLEPAARLKLGPSGLNGYFPLGGFGSDSIQRSALLKMAHRRAQKMSPSPIAPKDVFVVGDTPWDVKAGRAAGFTTIAVETGFATPQELRGSKPDHIGKDFRNTAKWLKWLGIEKARP